MKYCGFCLLAVVCLASTIRGEAAGPPNSLRIAVYESEANAAEYRGVHQSPLRAWLQRNHYDFEVIGDILGISRQACDGIRLYCLPKNDFDDARFRVVAELFGKWSSQETDRRK